MPNMLAERAIGSCQGFGEMVCPALWARAVVVVCPCVAGGDADRTHYLRMLPLKTKEILLR
jgi:hypothetical protein